MEMTVPHDHEPSLEACTSESSPLSDGKNEHGNSGLVSSLQLLDQVWKLASDYLLTLFLLYLHCWLQQLMFDAYHFLNFHAGTPDFSYQGLNTCMRTKFKCIIQKFSRLFSNVLQMGPKDFMDLLEKLQNSRINDQRCILPSYSSRVRSIKCYRK